MPSLVKGVHAGAESAPPSHSAVLLPRDAENDR